MPNEHLKKLQEYILYQEQWNRTSLSSFSTQGFDDINTVLELLSDENITKILEICEEQIQKNKNSIYALYIAGILHIQDNVLHDELLVRVLDIFSDQHKSNVVEYIAKKILTYRKNLAALNRLAEVYETSNRTEELIPIWQEIVRIDFEKPDILVKLAEYQLAQGNEDLSIKDYKKALQRYLQQKNFTPIKSIWTILVKHNPSDINFYFQYINKMEKILSSNRSETLLQILSEHYLTTNQYDTSISILKYLLRINDEELEYRDQLVEVYSKKYKNNPKLDDFIRMSNLKQSWRNVHEAISDFEKHISFFPGGFVHHAKWSIGCIKEVTHTHLTIDFSKKRDHQMDISMAVTSLEVLPKNHFWVLKSILSHEKLKKQILDNPFWGLKNILTSLQGADNKILKNELVPALLTPKEWTAWSHKARKILQENPSFGIIPDKTAFFYYSETPLKPLEKLNAAFNVEDTLLGRIKLIRKTLFSKSLEVELDEEIFLNIIEYFNSHISVSSPDTTYDENFVNSLFICHEIQTLFPDVQYSFSMQLKEVIVQVTMKNAISIIKNLKINEYKDLFFEYLQKYRDDWREILILLIPHYHTLSLIEIFEKNKEEDLLQKMFLYIQDNITQYKTAFVWFGTTLYSKTWLNAITDDFKLFSDLLRTASLIQKDINNKYQVPINKRLFATIEDFLFSIDTPSKKTTRNRIDEFIHSHKEKEVEYLYSLINNISDLLPNRIFDLRETILDLYPNFNFRDQFDFEQTGATGFLTLAESYEEKRKSLQHIHEVEVPENSKEIEKAREYGDLKENAEYKAAREHQELLNNRVAQLKKELEQARIFNKKNITQNDIVEFGTKISLLSIEDNSTKEYTILGPWESNPDKGIISYLSPLGQQLYKKKLKEEIKFVLDETPQTVKIEQINFVL